MRSESDARRERRTEAMVDREIVGQGLRRLHEMLDAVGEQTRGEVRSTINATTVDLGSPAFDVWPVYWPESAREGVHMEQRTIEAGSSRAILLAVGRDILREWRELSGRPEPNPADVEGTPEWCARMAGGDDF